MLSNSAYQSYTPAIVIPSRLPVVEPKRKTYYLISPLISMVEPESPLLMG